MYTDSLYLKNGITVWINKWKNNNWMTSNNKPVKNRDLWMRLYDTVGAEPERFDITWNWVKGHATTELHNEADLLARSAINSIYM